MIIFWLFILFSSICEVSGITEAGNNIGVYREFLVDSAAPYCGIRCRKMLLDIFETFFACHTGRYVYVGRKSFLFQKGIVGQYK